LEQKLSQTKPIFYKGGKLTRYINTAVNTGIE